MPAPLKATPALLADYLAWCSLTGDARLSAKLCGVSPSTVRPAYHGDEFALAVKSALRRGRLARKLRMSKATDAATNPLTS